MWFRLALALTLPSLPAWGGSSDETGLEFFEKRIRPVLATHCLSCHGPERQESGLRLDTRSSLIKGGRSGPVVMLGQPQNSRLYQVVTYRDPHLKMPPPGPLPTSVVEDIGAWIEAGAPWPETEPAPSSGTSAEGFDLAKRKQRYPWIWEPPLSQPPPSTRDSRWPRDPVDRFLLSKLEQNGLAPAPPADRRTWLRRVSFALTGLPPAPDEIRRFVDDRRPDAHALVADRLLASPRFGERWARHWMDLVHYAESRGHETDFLIANAFQYRDYLVRAFNADIPYRQLVAEHVAGDLLPAPRVDPTTGANESVIATGWPFFGEEEDSPVDLRQDEIERLDNRIDVLSKTFLGLTVSCARCHDHKFDAISQRDYYALFGFLLSSGYRQVRFQSMEHNRQVALELEALAAKYRPRILKAVGLAQKPQLEQTAAYLMAVRELVEAERETGCRFGRLAPAPRRKAAETLGQRCQDRPQGPFRPAASRCPGGSPLGRPGPAGCFRSPEGGFGSLAQATHPEGDPAGLGRSDHSGLHQPGSGRLAGGRARIRGRSSKSRRRAVGEAPHLSRCWCLSAWGRPQGPGLGRSRVGAGNRTQSRTPPELGACRTLPAHADL